MPRTCKICTALEPDDRSFTDIGGSIGLYYSLTLQTGVAGSPAIGGQTVHNLSLAHQQLIYVLVSLGAILEGTLLTSSRR